MKQNEAVLDTSDEKPDSQLSNSMVQDINKARNVKFSSPEINDMFLVWEELKNEKNEMIMMICSNANEYLVYNECDGEKSTLLRRVTGGHQHEISCMAYDFHLSLVATGSTNGEITVYGPGGAGGRGELCDSGPGGHLGRFMLCVFPVPSFDAP